jgi:hypothetical protein
LWDSVEFIPAHKDEQTVKDWNSVISRIPQTAVSNPTTCLPESVPTRRRGGSRWWGKKNKTIDITIIIISRQPDTHRFLNEIRWQEISPDVLKSVSDALKEISSGRQPAKFPPAQKWFVEEKKQDISFVKYFEDRRVELYLWRSKFKVNNQPLWYGAIVRSFDKTESEQTKLLKFFQDDVQKFAQVHKKIKIHTKKIKKKNLSVIEIPPDY